MNIVDKLEEMIKEEIKRLTNYNDLDWDAVFFDAGDLDFHDKTIDVYFWVGSYKNEYKFWYDYEYNTGALQKVEDDQSLTELWSQGSYD